MPSISQRSAKMRRIIAIALLLLFASAYVLPMAMTDAEQKLPLCCRGNGKHHCSMMDKLPQSGRPGFHTIRTKCHCWPASLVRSQEQSASICTSALSNGESPRHPAAFSQNEVGYLVSESRSHQKRGPPSLI